ncbi:MAG: glycine zipper 2TM domain-containing protein [Gammaproteobacteria bacterium]
MKTNMKLKLAMAGLLVAVAGTAAADPGKRGAGVDYARVVDVAPIVQRVRIATPARECWQETEYQTVRHETRSYAPAQRRVNTAVPTIAGGIIGGVIGHQFGSGSGKDAMTAVGALVGASMGNRAAYNQAPIASPARVEYEEVPVTVQRCQESTSYREEERIDGYRVTYVYAGREYVTTMASHPGTSIPVRVTVVPSRGRL